MSRLSPNFVIPVGTQVVLRKDLPVTGREHHFKKAGSVGEVEKAPLTHDYSYTVRFADGRVVRARKEDLAIRRTEAPETDLDAREVGAYESFLIYRVRVGSHAFGLADERSDTDERGVYLPPAEWHWSLQPLPEQIEFKRDREGRIHDHNEKVDADDFCWWEIEKFLRLALKANPNVLEVLWVAHEHVLFVDELGEKVRALRPAFLSKYVYQTYSGYVLSQFRKMKKDVEKGRNHRPKHACHLLRLLYSGIAALEGRGIQVDVGEHRNELLRVKRGEASFEEVFKRAVELDGRFQRAYDKTDLPDAPDIAAIDSFLIEARRRRV